MQSTLSGTRMSRWPVRSTTFLVWIAAAASLAYWGLKLTAPTNAGPMAPAALREPAPADPAALARLLGAVTQTAAAPATPSLASRFVLQGVVAGGPLGGAALIGLDGKPPRPYRVGAQLEEGLVLKAVERRRAELAATLDGPVLVTLELPIRR